VTGVRTEKVDVLIVGSGAGGGVVAQALAPLVAQGLRVVLVDRGGRFAPGDNTRREVEMAGRYYVANGGFQTSTQDMTLAFANAVGGSTNVYTGVTFEPPDHVLDKWAVPGLTADDLRPRSARYLAENNVHLQPEANINRNNRLFAEACRALGWDLGQFPLNLRDCGGLNTCNVGCARGAKQGTAQVQIPAAEKLGVEVIPFCDVQRLEGTTAIAEVLPARHGLKPAPWPVGPVRIEARRVVLAGGTMASPPLLMRSYADWERRWPALGRWFTCHPALTLVADHPERVDGAVGHPKSYYCDRFSDARRFLLETCFYFPFTTAKNLVGFGPAVDELMSRVAFQQQILVLVLDKAMRDNRIAIDKNGNPVAHYDLSAPYLRRAFVESIRAAGRIFFAAGATRAHLPAAGRFFTPAADAGRLDALVREDLFKLGQVAISAAHLMGGCRMGVDRATSVTDPHGRVHDLPGVYVADSSLFPDSVEVNPYLTIMALADRVAEAVRGDLAAG
jgi:choline dehydrogenase-like flavoprotein